LFLLLLVLPSSTLFLHDALPILMVLFVRLTWEFPLTMQIIAYGPQLVLPPNLTTVFFIRPLAFELKVIAPQNPAVLSSVGEVNRSEEHTSELQSRGHIVCRLLLE